MQDILKYDYELELINITKQFGDFKANDNINLKIKKGTIHAIIGENGAGKSTLMSIIYGIYQPTSGNIKIKGNTTFIKNPNQATDIGIGMVHQHFKLIDAYTNLDNIILGQESTKAKIFLDRKEARIKIENFQKIFNMHFDLDEYSGNSVVAVRQKVEIMKMLYRDAEILIFDEPTAVLTPKEIDEFLKILLFLKQKGKTIIFISHKLWEVKKVADEATVIRFGKVVKHYNSLKDVSPNQLAQDMVGKNIVEPKNTNHVFDKEVVLDIKNLNGNLLKNINLTVNKGQICAIAGVSGNGQDELESILCGLEKPKSGSIIYKNRNGIKEISKFGAHKKNKEFISVIPADRHKHGLVLDFSINNNSILKQLNNSEFVNPYTKFLKQKQILNFSHEIINKFDVRGSQNGYALARLLSGGNQQKAIIGREILSEHDFILVVQPTRGLDIGATNFIHQCLINEKLKGKAILLISYEIDEVMALADKIAVMNKGEIVGCDLTKNLNREQIGLYMAGKKEEKGIKQGGIING